MAPLAIALVLHSPLDPPDFGDLMVKLEVGTFDEVREAIRLLGNWRHKPAVDGLVRRLNGPNPRLRDMAAAALARIRTPATLSALYRARHLDGLLAAGAVGAVWVSKRRPRTPLGMRVLGRGFRVKDLLAALEDKSPDVRAAAARAIADAHLSGRVARVPSPLTVGRLAAAFRDKAAPVRAAAAKTLGQLGPPARSALGQLGILLYDPEVPVRCAAVAAIGRLADGRAARRYIRRALKDRDASVSAAAKLVKCVR